MPFARYWMHNAWLTTAGEKMSKSLGNSLLVPEVLQRFRAVEVRYYMVSSHYRSNVEYSDEAVTEAATAFRRIEGFVERAIERVGPVDAGAASPGGLRCGTWTTTSATPAALAVLHETLRAANASLAEWSGDSPRAVRAALADVRAMTGLLGVDPLDPKWGERRRRPLPVGGRRPGRRRARPAASLPANGKDYAAADADSRRPEGRGRRRRGHGATAPAGL